MGHFTISGNYVYKHCQYCGHKSTTSSLPRHEAHCYLNPKNIKLCPICGKPIKNYKKNQTCSTSCANTFFRSGKNNPNWKSVKDYTETNCKISEHGVRKICFSFHDKKCIICGENIIVEAHHYDGNNKNNHPANLVPLCPTHHRYWHSNHQHLIKKQVDVYLETFKNKLDSNNTY